MASSAAISSYSRPSKDHQVKSTSSAMMQGRTVAILPALDIKGVFNSVLSEECPYQEEPPTSKESFKTQKHTTFPSVAEAFRKRGLTILSQVGTGTYSIVLKVQNAAGEVFAAKVFNPSFQLSVHINEKQTMELVQSLAPSYTPRVVDSFSFVYDPDEIPKNTFPKNPDNIGTVILLDYYPATLFHLIRQMRNSYTFLSQKQILYILFQLLAALSKIESAITHGDLKPQNIFIQTSDDEHIDITLGDFGSSVKKGTEGSTPFFQTLWYRSPRTALLKREKLDIFSIGCILIELLTASPLFPTPFIKSQEQVETSPFLYFLQSFEDALQPTDYRHVLDLMNHLQNVFNVMGPPSQAFINQLPPLHRDFFFYENDVGQDTFRLDIDHNPHALTSILKDTRPDLHDNIPEYVNLIKMMLNYENPPSAAEVLQHPLLRSFSDNMELQAVS